MPEISEILEKSAVPITEEDEEKAQKQLEKKYLIEKVLNHLCDGNRRVRELVRARLKPKGIKELKEFCREEEIEC